MESLAYSESFYIFASIALIVVAVLAIVLITALTFAAFKIKKIIDVVNRQAEKISKDIDDARTSVQQKTEKFGGILQGLIGAFVVKKAVSKTRKRNKK